MPACSRYRSLAAICGWMRDWSRRAAATYAGRHSPPMKLARKCAQRAPQVRAHGLSAGVVGEHETGGAPAGNRILTQISRGGCATHGDLPRGWLLEWPPRPSEPRDPLGPLADPIISVSSSALSDHSDRRHAVITNHTSPSNDTRRHQRAIYQLAMPFKSPTSAWSRHRAIPAYHLATGGQQLRLLYCYRA